MKYGKFEFERSFLLANSCLDDLEVVRSKVILDKYITGTRLRLRKVMEGGVQKFKLTKKEELEPKKVGVLKINTLYLTREEFELQAALAGVEIEKCRHIVRANNYDIGIDEISVGGNIIYLAEVEFATEEEMRGFVFPLSYQMEVTGMLEYNGNELAEKNNKLD